MANTPYLPTGAYTYDQMHGLTKEQKHTTTATTSATTTAAIPKNQKHTTTSTTTATIPKEQKHTTTTPSGNSSTTSQKSTSSTSSNRTISSSTSSSSSASSSSASVITTTASRNATISVNPEEIKASAARLKEVAEKLDTLWNKVKVNQVNAVASSWVGKDAKIYTDKVLNMDGSVTAARDALVLIADTYLKAVTEVEQKQQELAAQINQA